MTLIQNPISLYSKRKKENLEYTYTTLNEERRGANVLMSFLLPDPYSMESEIKSMYKGLIKVRINTNLSSVPGGSQCMFFEV